MNAAKTLSDALAARETLAACILAYAFAAAVSVLVSAAETPAVITARAASFPEAARAIVATTCCLACCLLDSV